jgi:GH15 family glucan-1,4-alpha-glucosidase
MNGQNPWPICSIWMALYYYRINDLDKVYKILKFVVETSNSFGFLAEQVDNNTKEPVWVTGLGWSHAMFILLLDKLTK